MQNNLTKDLEQAGWKKSILGKGKSKDYNEDFACYIRRRNFVPIPWEGNKTETLKSPKNGLLSAGAKNTMGTHTVPATPKMQRMENNLAGLLSLQAIRASKGSFVIALDTEFTGNPRRILSYQFAFLHNNQLYEIIFLPLHDKRLPLSIALGHIFDLLEWESYDYRPTRRFRSFVSVDSSDRPVYQDYRLAKDAEMNALFYVDAEGKPFDITIGDFNLLDLEMQEKRYGYVSPENYAQLSAYLKKHKYKVAKLYHKWNDFSVTKMYNSPVTIICHAGKVDLSALEFKDFESDIFHTTTEVQGGIVSMMPKFFHPSSGRTYWRYYPCMIDFRDTMCYAPAKQKKLADLGQCIGVPKIDIDPDVKNDMYTFLSEKPAEFFEYASTDSVITLLYASKIFGYNKKLPITLSSAAAAIARHILSDYFACKSDDDLDLYYRGLVKKRKGIVPKNGNAGFVEATNLEPVNDRAMLVQQMATNAYRGGVNASSIIGYYDNHTYDYDLKNAYPTCMCVVPDINWTGQIIAREFKNQYITSKDFKTPFDPMFCYIKFKFPDNVAYPCIAVSVDGCMIFPQTSDGLDGVYAVGTDIYLALQLGAEIWCERGYVAEARKTNDETSHSLGMAVYQLVRDRALAKQLYKKGSLIEQVLKTLVNTLYGKVAQGVVQKQTWSARSDEMVDIGYSAITSPCAAAIITGGVRAVLLAAMNQLTQKGYHVYSVTTDGFISDAPPEALYKMDLFGFAGYFADARKFLTDGEDDTMWEIKHEQCDLLNITTRGNVSLNLGDGDLEYAGVCAHNAWQSGEKPDTYEDRIAYMTSVLSRQGSLICREQRWLGYKEMVRQRLDFRVSEVVRKVSMDYDLKRCPMYKSGKTVYPEINNTSYEIFNFDTRPFNNIDEYIKYRDCKKRCKVLRTQQDWKLFFAKLEVKEAGTCQHIKDLEWSKLFSVIMGYRIGLWDIPALDELKSVAKKIEWINTHNHSAKKFTQNDWKNARRQERATQILPRQMLCQLLVEMGVVV